MLGNYKRILTPIDGSDQSQRAFEQAIQIAKRNQATLVIAMVVDDNLAFLQNIYRSGLKEGMTNRANEIIDRHVKIADWADFDQIERIVEYGKPKDVISHRLVDDQQIDLIVMGSRGMGATGRIILGSTTEHVVRHAHCDVLVVRDHK